MFLTVEHILSEGFFTFYIVSRIDQRFVVVEHFFETLVLLFCHFYTRPNRLVLLLKAISWLRGLRYFWRKALLFFKWVFHFGLVLMLVYVVSNLVCDSFQPDVVIVGIVQPIPHNFRNSFVVSLQALFLKYVVAELLLFRIN